MDMEIMGWACAACGRDQKCVEHLSRTTGREELLGDLGLDEINTQIPCLWNAFS